MLSRWLPVDVSTYGGDIDSLFFLIYYIVGFWFLLTEGALVFFVVRYRRRPGRRAAYNRGDTVAEVVGLLIPAAVVLALDLGIDAVGARTWQRVKGELPPAAASVRITARQFNWEFTYPGPDGKFGTADDLSLENALHVPAKQVVRAVLTSEDVIHSFFVPALRLKQDAVPGREIAFWFEAREPGQYEIACAELCGFGHYTMRGLLTVHTAADYRRWVGAHWPAKARGGPPGRRGSGKQ